MGTILATHPLDTRVTLPVENEATWDVAGPEDFTNKVATSAAATKCFARQLSRYYGVQAEQPEDACRVGSMFDALAKDHGTVLGAIKAYFVYPTIGLKRAN